MSLSWAKPLSVVMALAMRAWGLTVWNQGGTKTKSLSSKAQNGKTLNAHSLLSARLNSLVRPNSLVRRLLVSLYGPKALNWAWRRCCLCRLREVGTW